MSTYSLITKSQKNWSESKISGNMNKLNTFCLFETNNKLGFPEVESDIFNPNDLIPFHTIKKKLKGDKDKTVHFFLDDYKFEQLWSDPRKYIEMLSHYNGMISPTFSLWSNQPYALNLYNLYRSRWCTRFFQEVGIQVLVDVRWCDVPSYDYAFSGIKKHTPVIVNTVGTRSLDNRALFTNGFYEMLCRLEPSELYVYGEYMPLNFEQYFDKVTYFESFWKKQRDRIAEKEKKIIT